MMGKLGMNFAPSKEVEVDHEMEVVAVMDMGICYIPIDVCGEEFQFTKRMRSLLNHYSFNM